MYCWKCGTQIAEESRFCYQCGAAVARPEVDPVQIVEVPESTGRQTFGGIPELEPAKPSQSRGGFWRVWRAVVLALRTAFGIAVLGLLGLGFKILLLESPGGFQPLAIALVFGVLGFEAVLLLAWKPKPVVWRLVLGVGLSVGLGVTTFVVASARKEAAEQRAIGIIQEAMVEVAVAKSVGDEIMLGQVRARRPGVVLVRQVTARGSGGNVSSLGTGPAMQDVRKRAEAAFDRLSDADVSERLEDYRSSVRGWAYQVTFAAIVRDPPSEDDRAKWSALPSEPRPVTLEWSVSRTALEASAQSVAAAKEFGDAALARSDRETMRYVAARLKAKNYWLSGVIVGNPQCRWFPRGSRTGLPCTELREGLSRVVSSAWNYLAQDPSAAQQWSDAWATAPSFIQPGGQPIGGVGITPGEPVEPTGGPPRWFSEQCAAKGGILGGQGGVMTGLPTTESGWTCWYGPPAPGRQERVCWDLLTYSGGRYMGDNPGCPVLGLVAPAPAPPAQPPGPAQPPRVASWDGVYEGESTCLHPEGPKEMLLSGPIRFEVQRNVVTLGNFRAVVDSSGRGSITEPGELGNDSLVLQFSRSSVTGEVTVEITGRLTGRDLRTGRAWFCSFSATGRPATP